MFIGGGQLYNLQSKERWKLKVARYYRGDLDVDVCSKGELQLFCLMHDAAGKLIAKRFLGQIKQNTTRPFRFSFKPKSNTQRFNLAVYMSTSNLPKQVNLRKINLKSLLL